MTQFIFVFALKFAFLHATLSWEWHHWSNFDQMLYWMVKWRPFDVLIYGLIVFIQCVRIWYNNHNNKKTTLDSLLCESFEYLYKFRHFWEMFFYKCYDIASQTITLFCLYVKNIYIDPIRWLSTSIQLSLCTLMSSDFLFG